MFAVFVVAEAAAIVRGVVAVRALEGFDALVLVHVLFQGLLPISAVIA